MSWWRSDDWREVIADSSDPAVARLSLAAAAGRSIGFDALAAASESPEVVYAYNRAGADESYAADVVAALDVYDRTTTALMAAGMPESIAASRAALVFGTPMVDSQYLAIAKQPVMPADMLVASADEALARAFAHLVVDGVHKADEPWDESEVNRDDLGRFAPEAGAQQAYRVVDGRKVAISTQVKTEQKVQRQNEEVKASSTDEQMLADLARQNEESRKYAADKRAKRLKRLQRIQTVQSSRKIVAEREEAKAKAQQRTRGTQTQTTAETATSEQKRKVLSRRTMNQGRTAEQIATDRAERRKAKYLVQARELKERQEAAKTQARSRYGGGGRDPFDANQYDTWEEAGYGRERLWTADTYTDGVFKDPEDASVMISAGSEMDLLLTEGGLIVDGGQVIARLVGLRNAIANEGYALAIAGIDSTEENYARVNDVMVRLVDKLYEPIGGRQVREESIVYLDTNTYAPLSELTAAFLSASEDTSGDMWAQPNFQVMVYNPDRQVWTDEVRTLRIPTLTTDKRSLSLQITKADETWDESEVRRDAIGRFAPEGHREAVVGGRKVLVKVEQSAQKVESKAEIARTSTDAQDLAWVARQNRNAAMRRRRQRLQRIQAAQKAQTLERLHRPVGQILEQGAVKVAEKKQASRKVLRRATISQNRTTVRFRKYDRVQINAALKEIQSVTMEDPSNIAHHVVMNPTSTPVGRVLDALRIAMADETSEERQAWRLVLHVSQNSAAIGMGSGRATMARGVAQVVVGEPTFEGPTDTEAMDEEIDDSDDYPVIDPESADLLSRMMTGESDLNFEIRGDGTDAAPFELTEMNPDPQSERTEPPTELRFE